MSPRWRLLGPQEAGCGTLAFGWSTAAIVRRRTERSTEGFATLRERFATWIAVSNKSGSLGLAFPLLYVVRMRSALTENPRMARVVGTVPRPCSRRSSPRAPRRRPVSTVGMNGSGPRMTTQTDRDDSLVAALRRGEPTAAEDLVAAYGDRASRLANRITGNAQDAEENVRDRAAGLSVTRVPLAPKAHHQSFNPFSRAVVRHLRACALPSIESMVCIRPAICSLENARETRG